MNSWLTYAFLTILCWGAYGIFLHGGAVGMAEAFGLSERVIGLTVVALGTSAPELFTAAMASYRDEADMALGNSIGSNILNIWGALGITAIISPIVIHDRAVWGDMALAVVGTFLMIPLVLRGRHMGRVIGALCFFGYVGYTVYLARGSM